MTQITLDQSWVQQNSAPQNVEALLSEALSYLRSGETAKALACLSSNPDLTQQHDFTCYLAGLIHATSGGGAETALGFYERAVELRWDNVEAQYGRAVMLLQLGRVEEALAAFEVVLCYQPASIEILHNCGEANYQLGAHAEALAYFLKALAIDPTYQPALSGCGLVLTDLGRHDEALAIYDRLLEAHPNDATGWYNRAIIFTGRGDHERALECYQKALALRPDYVMALYGAASLMQTLERPANALFLCDELLRYAPYHFEALLLRGNALNALGRMEEALAAFNVALAHDPNEVRALCNKGSTLKDLARLSEAQAVFEAALAIRPDFKEAWLGLGNQFLVAGEPGKAMAAFDRALQIDAEFAEVHCGRALALKELGLFDEALAEFDCTLAIDPNFVDARANKGALQLLLGDFEQALEGFEYRWVLGTKTKVDFPTPFPEWQGEDLTGKSIVVLDEAGLGDVLQFSRYLIKLGERGARVSFQCRPSLHKLMRTLPVPVNLIDVLQPSHVHDFSISLLSLPRVFETRIHTIPHQPMPYLKADEGLVQKWRGLLGEQGFKIGIVWQGNPTPKADMWRAAPLAAFAPLAQIENVRLISLQKGFGEEQLSQVPFKVETLGDDFDAGPDAFADTAAVMMALDVVLSIDTSVAHLAGALGAPAWIILKKIPEWRWFLNREDSPWYPGMRLFRQQRRADWESAMALVSQALAQATAGRKA